MVDIDFEKGLNCIVGILENVAVVLLRAGRRGSLGTWLVL